MFPIINEFVLLIRKRVWNRFPTFMKWLISLLMRAFRSAFLSVQFWPEYLWKTLMIVAIPLSNSEAASLEAWNKQFKTKPSLSPTQNPCFFFSFFSNLHLFKILVHLTSICSSCCFQSGSWCDWGLGRSVLWTSPNLTADTELYRLTTRRLLIRHALLNVSLMDASGRLIYQTQYTQKV